MAGTPGAAGHWRARACRELRQDRGATSTGDAPAARCPAVRLGGHGCRGALCPREDLSQHADAGT
eukprot:12184485-Alexandrium_andersonii.AAC.1